jgi:ATP-dependent helicase/nuclease subunit A
VTEPDPTAEQQRAIGAPGAAVIRAGAGTGKTAVLAHRFVELVRPRGVEPPLVDEVGRVLAITFTEKAAAEMKGRIRALVGREVARAADDTRRHWQRVQRDLLGAQISTIHAFCGRVVRENPLEGGIDPHAAILDEHESRAYLETVVEEELGARLRAGDGAARDLIERRRGLRAGRDGGAVGLCLRFLAVLGTTGRDATWLAAAAGRQEAAAGPAAARMRAAVERIVGKVERALAAGPGNARLRTLGADWPALKARLERFGPASPVGDLDHLEAVLAALRSARLAGDVKDDLAAEDGRLGGTLAAEYGSLLALPATRALARLLGEIADAVRARKRADAVLTFDDLITETRALFRGHPAVLARYARRFRAVLVDEFQDTDGVQADVIQRLAAEGAILFVVGDEKQSIYRFRGADVGVFQRLRRTIGSELPLGTNFRSVPEILDFVNALATATLRRPPGAAEGDHWTEFEERDRLVPDRAAGSPAPAVRLVTFSGVPGHAARRVGEAREIEGRVLAEVIARLGEPAGGSVRFGDVAVLFRALSQVKAYEYALRRREIPYYVVKGRGFFQCQEVRDVLSLLATVADPTDEVALAAALRSPFFAVDDDALWRLAWPAGADRARLGRRFCAGETFADLPAAAAMLGGARDLLVRLRRLRSRATIAELLEEALAATDFEAVCLTQFQGTQKVANVRKLIELARAAERRRHLTLRDFVGWARRLTEREPREPEAPLVGERDDVVRLMTIHQAKGLEFPVVILVDLGRDIERDWTPVVLDDDLGVIAAPTRGAGAFPLRHARLEEHRTRERDRTRAEHARLLYVACTRARDLLVLLEGKGNVHYLTAGLGDPDVWCHRVWDTIGRERVAAFVTGPEAAAVLDLPDGGRVLLERAESYLATTPEVALPLAPPEETPATEEERAAVLRVLGFTPPRPAELVASPTALADFRRCPRQYWYRHVLGLPERGSGGARARLLGTAAHGVLEAVDLARATEEDVARALAATPEALTLAARDQRALAESLGRAVRAVQAEMAAGLEFLGREVPFVLPLPRERPLLFLQGRIDVLARRERAVVVRDYKYGRPSAGAAERHGAQLGAYGLAAATLGGARVEVELVFLRDGPVVWPLAALDARREEETLVRAGRELAQALARGDLEAFPRRPPAPLACEALGCGYVGRCWGRGLAHPVTGRASPPPSGSVAS